MYPLCHGAYLHVVDARHTDMAHLHINRSDVFDTQEHTHTHVADLATTHGVAKVSADELEMQSAPNRTRHTIHSQ